MTLLGATIYINLDRDTARRTHMEAECAKAGLSPVRLSAANGAAFIAAGLLSVLVFPLIALTLMGETDERSARRPGTTRLDAAT